MEKPNWWPENPYPESIFPMKHDEYPGIIPDPHQRTALSGMSGRVFWDIASKSIWDAIPEDLKTAIKTMEKGSD